MVMGADETTTAAVHASWLSLVSQHSVTNSIWAEYAAVLLDPETEAFFAVRLGAPVGVGEADAGPPSKKRKASTGVAAEITSDGGLLPGLCKEEEAGLLCGACGGAVPQMPVTVAALDGTMLRLRVPQRSFVREVKRTVAQARDVHPGLIDLFVEGTEDPLPPAGRLHDLGVQSGTVLFVLQRPGWVWETCGSATRFSENGLMARIVEEHEKAQLVSGGPPMTEGQHYWEVLISAVSDYSEDGCCMDFGCVRPLQLHGLLAGTPLDHNGDYEETDSAYFINAGDGGLLGNGKDDEAQCGGFKKGDRVGVQLDLDAGWMRFYLNGVRHGPGFTEGVTGPLLRAVELVDEGDAVVILPGASCPPEEGDGWAGAGDEA
jgi:hypothetical protein